MYVKCKFSNTHFHISVSLLLRLLSSLPDFTGSLQQRKHWIICVIVYCLEVPAAVRVIIDSSPLLVLRMLTAVSRMSMLTAVSTQQSAKF
jgi:hypothetical protein